jgi:hypothetical protein
MLSARSCIHANVLVTCQPLRLFEQTLLQETLHVVVRPPRRPSNTDHLMIMQVSGNEDAKGSCGEGQSVAPPVARGKIADCTTKFVF